MVQEMSAEEILGASVEDVFQEDFSDVRPFTGFEPLSQGWHEFEVAEVQPEKKGPKGPYITIILEANDAEEGESNRVWHNISFAEESAGARYGFLLACGLAQDKKFNWGGTPETRGKPLLGQQVMGNVKHKVYEGDTKAYIGSFKPVDN